MTTKNTKNVAFGAVIGSLLGSLSALLTSHRSQALQKGKDWMGKVKNVSETIYNEAKHFYEPNDAPSKPAFMAGALVGLVLGAGSALLLSPKSGKQWREALKQKYESIFDKAHDWMDEAVPEETVKTIKHRAAAFAKKIKPKTLVKKAANKAKKKLA